LVERGEVLPDRVGQARGTSLPARKLHGAGEVWKPRHVAPPCFLAGQQFPGTADIGRPAPSSCQYLPRSRRRTLVAIALAGYPAAVAVLAGLHHASLNRWFVLAVFLLLLLPTLATLAVSYRYAWGRTGGRRARLDERDLSLRQQAYALSHRSWRPS
jgi:hypothetical protein